MHIVSCETCVAQNVVVHMGSMNTRSVSMGEEMHEVSFQRGSMVLLLTSARIGGLRV